MRMHVPVASVVEAAAKVGLRNGGRALLTASNAKAPRDDGDLIKSGGVRVDDLTVQVSYTAPHAHLQHEKGEWRHEGGGQSKFLEAAADEVDIGAIIADAVRKELSG